MSFIDQPKIQFADNAVRDAFGNLRTTTPFTVFNSRNISIDSTIAYDTATTGGATSALDGNTASVLMTVPATTVSSVIRQSKRWSNYQPGKSHKILCTGVMGAGVSGITKRIGYFETNDGVFFQQLGTTLSVVIRSSTSGSPVDTVIAQSAWNIDKMDGTGTTGITLDMSKTHIFVMDFQWLGVGRVRFGFSIGGNVYYCHEINHANIDTIAYMRNPNLPIRYEISNNGTGASTSMRQICASVESEGGEQELGVNRFLTRGITPLSTLNDTNIYPLITFRHQSAHKYIDVHTIKYSIACTSTAFFEYMLIVNPVFAGTAPTYTPLSNSAIEFDVTTTSATTITGFDFVLDGGLDQSGTITQTIDTSWHQ